MFTGKSNDKKIVMQMDLIEDEFCPKEILGLYPESILICSDGSVIAGHGRKEISIVAWFPSFEMMSFYSTDEYHRIDTDLYTVNQSSIQSLNMNYIIPGPI